MGSSPGISYTLSRGGGSGFRVERTPHSYAPRFGAPQPPRPSCPGRASASLAGPDANAMPADLLSSRPPPGRRHLPMRKACWERKGLGAEPRPVSGSHSNQSRPGILVLPHPRGREQEGSSGEGKPSCVGNGAWASDSHRARPALGRAPVVSPPLPLPRLPEPLMMDEKEEDDDEEAWLQLRPVEPLPSQCCGSGCSPCVFDLYDRDLARWEAARASKDRSLLRGKESPNFPSKLSPETFLAFRISAMDKLTQDTYCVRFALPGSSQLGLRPGQHLILRGTVDGLEIQRAYTPISPVNAEGYFEVLIKCYQTGLMSRYVESLRAGDTAFWRGPFGNFFYKPNQYGELLMLASGTGLAPMVPLLHSITDNAEDETFVTLVSCFKTFEGIYLKTFLQEQARFWNVRTFFVLSQENSPEQLPWSYREKTRFGRLGQDLIEELVGSCRRKPFALVCGSAEFTEDMAKGLLRAGLAKDSYFLF
ncbi:NADH-cytochrome b5 reductase-like isoform X1 [Myotis myotis]|uniref:NADH-cytochrome b5 reductase-like isoform X1 n=2 Tax=Myotis myotis TaxID=51298 RepID=UPI00174C969C|nr:NADH-cytochrome b5 reductase-like isoform X1 [Myotis myotis]